MFFTIALYTSLAVFVIGLVYRISNWFRYNISPDGAAIAPSTRLSSAAKGVLSTLFSAKAGILLKVFAQDVLFQRYLMKKDFLRWLAHICIYGGFMLLLLMHGLDKLITSVLFDDYYSTLNPFMFLRDFFGAVVIFGLALVLYRRLGSKAPRPKTTGVDYYAISILALIMISGVLLEGAKIISYSKYQQMVEEYAGPAETDELRSLEAFWVHKFGVVSTGLTGPFGATTINVGKQVHEMSCASCHSRPQWAFMGYGTAKALGPAALLLDRANTHSLLWYLHFLACFFGLAFLPFSKFFHIFATPVHFLVNAVIEEGKSDPANIATKQAIELDACTHCGDCTIRCSVAVAFEEIPNPNILPSEKLAALKAVVSGKLLSKQALEIIQEGSHICTDCRRCTEVCPIHINLQDLWLNLKRSLAELGYPKPEIWAREAISANYDLAEIKAQTLSLTPVDKVFLNELTGSAQAATFAVCFDCRNCTSVCPVVANYANPKEAVDLLPHQIMHALALGRRDLAISPAMLWDCTTCYLCQEHCPQGVRVTDVLYELKNHAIRHLRKAS
ncbi:MAG: 4Fe-4S dicluster domain-containing protein [Desulfobacterales bacterium]|nr:4Fe-4S dicluster domain-containing protein [Desulfobacterales bacterium]